MTLPEQYISDVISGNVTVCEYVRQAVNRHVSDLETLTDYYFDAEAGERVLNIVKVFRHTKGEYAGKPFNLQPFQAFLIYVLFGWKRKDTGKRRFTKAYVEIARKNGKTELAAVIALYMLMFDGEQGAEVYTAATKRDQAKICFDACKVMGRYAQKDSKRVNKALNIYKHNIHIDSTNSKLEPLGADSDTLDGLSPSCAIVDEYHAHKDDTVLKVLETGMGGRTQPLLFVITTAGFNINGPCYQYRKVCEDILAGRVDDPSTFALIYSLDEGDDWNDSDNWQKANPNIGETPSLEWMEAAHRRAQNEGATAEIQFKTKNLNYWTTVSETWIPDDVWMSCAGEVNPVALHGRTCFGGLDLASTRDICALSLYFPSDHPDDPGQVLMWYWIPQDNADARSRRDRVPYLDWIREGYIEATDGNVTNYEYIKARIIDLMELYNIQTIGYDRHNASQLVIDLTEQGVKMGPFGQGYISMNAPTKELEKLAFEGKINHGGCPVLRWMASNVQIKTDPAGNIKIDRGKSREKVDGMIALVMALGEAMTAEKTGPSKYENQDMFWL
jgi:phage terminase large subunit-like protein